MKNVSIKLFFKTSGASIKFLIGVSKKLFKADAVKNKLSYVIFICL